MTVLTLSTCCCWIPTVAWLLLTLTATLVTGDDSRILVISVTAGIGGFVLLVVVALVAFACILKHRRLNGGEKAALGTTRSNENALPVELSHSGENVMNSSLPGENRPSGQSVLTVDRASIDDPANYNLNIHESVGSPSQPPYHNDTSGMYESANTSDTPDTRLYTSLRQT